MNKQYNMYQCNNLTNPLDLVILIGDNSYTVPSNQFTFQMGESEYIIPFAGIMEGQGILG